MTNQWTETIDALRAENARLEEALTNKCKRCGKPINSGMTAAEAEAVVRMLVSVPGFCNSIPLRNILRDNSRVMCERFLLEFPGHDELVSRIWEEEFGESWG